MNKQAYLNQLRTSLSDLPQAELEDILYDYAEHFDVALSKGETEEAILEQLGRPEIVAKQFHLSKVIQRAEEKPSSFNLFRAVIASVGLGLFNIIFILGPYLALAGILIAVFAVAVALIVTGIGLVFSAVVITVTGTAAFLPVLSMVGLAGGALVVALLGAGVAIAAVGGLLMLLAIKMTKLFYRATIHYLKLNVRMVTHQ
ncbi:MAG: DUF1700 domain-containing protein [Erysipelotrichaceae bacterium]|nr:DUF1700 domain-containing protein [Erysipelotrichaceae bacterium]